jgi:hypothetical protein
MKTNTRKLSGKKPRRLSGKAEIERAFDTAIKRCQRKGIRDKDTVIRAMVSEVEERGLFSLENIRKWCGESASDWWSLIAMRAQNEARRAQKAFLQIHGTESIGVQLNLFFHESTMEVCYTIDVGGVSELIRLGDFGLQEISAKREQDRIDVEHRTATYNAFIEAADQIEPLLKANPTWKWVDAARYLRSDNAEDQTQT